ncbi:MAG: tetratricopeptide repeat protein, partial [bacterium]
FSFSTLPANSEIYPEKDWTCRIKPDIGRSLLLFTPDNIIVENADRVVYFIDRNTGARQWEYRFSDTFTFYKLDDYTFVVQSGKTLNEISISHKNLIWSSYLNIGAGDTLLSTADNSQFAVRHADDTFDPIITDRQDQQLNSKPAPTDYKPLIAAPSMIFDPNIIPGGALSIDDRRISFTPSDSSLKGWTYDSERLLAKTALLLRKKLFIISSDGLLQILDPDTGALTQKLMIPDYIEMRFWDEKPENLNNYSNSFLFSDENFIFVVAPSSITRFKLNSFPKELNLKKAGEPEESTADWALNRAITQWDQKNYASSVKMLTDVVEVWPKSANGHLFLGMAYSSAGKFDEAINELEKAHAIEPENFDIASNLAGNYYIKLFSLDPSQQSDKILEMYEKIRSIQPTDTFAYTGPAEIYIGRHEYDKAIGVLSESFSHAFSGPGPIALLLSSYYMADRGNDVIKTADNMIRLFPDSDIAYLIKGKQLCKKGLYAAASDTFKSAPPRASSKSDQSLYPRLLTSGWQFFYGNALGLSGRYKDGIISLSNFISSLPTSEQFEKIKLFEQQSIEQNRSGKTAESDIDIPKKFKGISSIELSAELEFKIPALLSISHFQFRLGNSAESVKTIKRIENLKPKPEDPDTLSYIAYLLVLNKSDLPHAREYIFKALKSNPEDPIFLRNYAVYLSSAGKNDLAEKTFKKALAISDYAELTHFEYGRHLTRLKRKPEAVAQFKEELKITPDLDMAKKELLKLGSK